MGGYVPRDGDRVIISIPGVVRVISGGTPHVVTADGGIVWPSSAHVIRPARPGWQLELAQATCEGCGADHGEEGCPVRVRAAVHAARDAYCRPYGAPESSRSPGWYEAECACGWTTSGYEDPVDTATYEHVQYNHPEWWRSAAGLPVAEDGDDPCTG